MDKQNSIAQGRHSGRRCQCLSIPRFRSVFLCIRTGNQHLRRNANLMHNTIFYIILIVLSFGFILERILDYLNSKTWTDKLPLELQDVYDAEEYKKSQLYKKENDRFGHITANFSFIVIIAVLLFSGFAWV